MACIFVFGGRIHLWEHIEYKLKIKRNQFISNSADDPSLWEIFGQYFTNKIDTVQYGVKRTYLSLVCLFRDQKLQRSTE